MKVNYLPKSRSKRPYFKHIFVLVMIFISGAAVFSFLEGALVSLASHVWKTENRFIRSLDSGVTFLRSQKALVAENSLLKEKLHDLEAEILYLSSRKIEEEALFKLLDRKGESNSVVGAVLTRPPQTPYDTIVVDAGSNESVVVGSKVSLPEGPILGTVSEVFPGSAKIKLFSAVGEETGAVLERNSIPVTLIGAGGGNFRFTLPRDMAVEKGDRIVSPDISSRLLASVGEVSVRPTDSFKEILAQSPTNIFSLRFVFITP